MAWEAGLRKSNLIMPLIVDESGSNSRYLMTTPMDSLENKVQKVLDLGIKKIMLYGIPKTRNAKATEAWNPKGVVQSAVRRIKKNFGHKVEVSTDVCVCQYNLSGQCGTMNSSATDIDNDASLIGIKTIALSHAEAGSDIMTPSSMMDGQVSCIRQCLKENGFRNISIMSFSAKYDSCLYSPFRSTTFDNYHQTRKINKSTYQSIMLKYPTEPARNSNRFERRCENNNGQTRYRVVRSDSSHQKQIQLSRRRTERFRRISYD